MTTPNTERLQAQIEEARRDYRTVFPPSEPLSPNLELAFRALNLLLAAEHRATRAESQSDIRGRAVIMYRERAREAEARIKAVRELHQHGGSTFGDGLEDHTPVCADCLEEWPCPTTRALEG